MKFGVVSLLGFALIALSSACGEPVTDQTRKSDGVKCHRSTEYQGMVECVTYQGGAPVRVDLVKG